jgi:DNA (cytosine-5)-methyltransferase 1
MKKHKVLDLFSGIGGFSLGLERTGGFETVAFCEIDKYCQRVLKKHWNHVPIYNDIKELTNDRLAADGIFPTVLTAGFPCQDLSQANANAKGLDGERSGLFFEITRLVREIRPDYCILENVTTLLDNRNFGRVLGEFSEIGDYVVEWNIISAADVGCLHRRNRIWIVARNTISNPKSIGHGGGSSEGCSDGERVVLQGECGRGEVGSETSGCGESPGKISNSDSEGVQRHSQELEGSSKIRTQETTRLLCGIKRTNKWQTESRICRVSHGIPNWSHRIKCIGNSLVPQIPEQIGNAILEYEKENQ